MVTPYRAPRCRATTPGLLGRRAAVGAEAVGLHLGVDRSAADTEPAGGERGVAIAAQRGGQRGPLDGAHRAVGDVLQALAIAQAMQLDRGQLDALVAGVTGVGG